MRALAEGLLLQPGLRVGLLGGSFDPPHPGHLHLSQQAKKRFGLDCVVWLVSPGNPLKKNAPATLNARMTAADQYGAPHPWLYVSDFEARFQVRHTYHTLSLIRQRFPKVRFTWLMGADNLAGFHFWQRWQGTLGQVPVGVLARPGHRQAALNSPAARMFRHHRLPHSASHLLGQSRAPCWCFVNMPLNAQSSTAIRSAGNW